MTVPTMPSSETDDRRVALETIARALRREAHVLAVRPELTWQQLYNRLQWAEPPFADRLAAERERRSRPWIHRYSRLRESEALIRTLTGHTSWLGGCAVSPDGSWLVSASDDHTLKIWDVASGNERATLTGHTDGVWGCAVSPDGSWIVSASGDHSLKIWDAATGAERATLTGHTDGVWGRAVSPDGTWIVSASRDGTLKIWDAATWAERTTLTGHTDGVRGCAVSPDGTWIVSASGDHSLKIWDAASGSERATLTGHTDGVWGCAVSPDGTWIVSASDDHTLKIWDAVTWAERATLTGHTEGVWGCAVSPDGSWIVSASDDGTLKIWDALGGSERVTLASHTGWVWGCAVSPDGSWIVSASGDHTLKIWDAASGGEQATLTGHPGWVSGCAVSPDGSWIVSAGGTDQTLKIWDVATGAERATLTGHTGWVKACAVSPDGSWIVSAGDDHTLRIWDAPGGSERVTLSGHTGFMRACAVSPDGNWIVSASSDQTLRIWDAASGSERTTMTGHMGGVTGCAVSPDGSWIVSASGDHTLKIWDAATWAERTTLTGHTDEVWGCAVSPDGSWIVSASIDQTLKIWDVASGSERATLTGHTDGVKACAVSPDGSWIVSAGDDRTLKVWDAATGTELATLALPGTSTAVSVHPYAPIVACGDHGGSVHLAHLVGLELGPLVVTAAVHDNDHELTVRCPACREAFDVDPDRLGTETTCPRPACGRRLRVNSFLVQPLDGPAPALAEPIPPAADLDLTDLATQTRPNGATPTLPDLLAQSGLSYLAVGGGSLAMGFQSTRAERLIVQARTLESGLAFFAVSLPRPGLFGGETALRSLLGVSFRADYVKALVFPDGELAFACEQELALLSPARVRGLVAGLAALGDVKKGDLADGPGWDRRLATCRLAQAADIEIDPMQASAAIRRLAADGGLSVQEGGTGTLIVDLDPLGIGAPLKLVIRVNDHLVSIIASLGDAKPKGDKSAYLRRMLELNRAADVARLALDLDGDVALLYEVPEVGPELFSRVREQFGRLLLGLVTLEGGG